LINSFRHLRSIDPGFASHHILTAGISMPEAKYPSEQLRSRFVHELVAQVRRQPGVQHASAVSVLPESSNFNQMAMDIQGRVFARGESPSLDQYDVTPDYFRELRIPLLQGRWFSEQDDRNHAYVALINQTAARRLWQSRNPIGEKVHTGAASEPWRTIVGVVGDVYQYGLDSQKTMQIYYPYQQDANFDLTLMVQSEMSPAALASELRQAVRAIDKDLPLSDVQPLDQVLSDSVAGRRFSMLLLALFAGAALVLASVGIYGVISYSVTQRLNEFGIRVALGANRGDILRQVLRQSTLLAAGGTAIGLAAAFGLTRLLASLLFGVSATDLPTFAVVAAVLMGVALAATINPALRATQTDPMSAMRNE